MTVPASDLSAEPTTGRRRLLVVSYFFPPTGGVGVQRTLKFVRHLRPLGWRVIVLTPANPAYPIRDPGLLAEVPNDVELVRTACPEPAALAGSLGRRLGRQTRAMGTPASMAGQPPDLPPANAVGGRRGVPGPIRAILRTGARWWVRLVRLGLFPDDQALWWPFAVLAGRRALGRQPVDAVYSSSPPVTTHLIAGSLRRVAGRPWVADFRDPWVGNAFAEPLSPPKRRLQAWLERRIVETADRVVVASPSMEAAFRARYPRRAARILCIPNGYDRADLDGIVPRPRDPSLFTIVFGGSLYGERELRLFLDGLERLLRRRPDLRARLRIEFVGRVNVANQRVADLYSAPARLGEVVSYTGFLPRTEALRRMRSADALLQLIADDPGKEAIVGAKTLESLAFDLPILAAVPHGDARALLEELDWGIVVDPEPEAITNGIERLLEAPKPGRRSDPGGRYDRATQARRLAAILDEVVAEAAGLDPREPRPC